MAETTTDLWRSVREEDFANGVIINDQPAPGVLFPDFYKRTLPNGKDRNPDVVLEPDGNGVEWVQPGRGTSLFDSVKPLSGKSWLKFKIPGGTAIDGSLTVRFTGYNKIFKANHYQIECINPMTITAYKGALDNLARSAIARLVQLAH